MILDGRLPIVLAPLAGGPSTPELAAAVSDAGGLGFLAGGYLTAEALAGRIATTRRLTTEPFGVNLFVPQQPGSPTAIAAYAATLTAEARAVGAELGPPRPDDDGWAAKVVLLEESAVPVVSFTFGLLGSEVVERLRRAGSEVWVTVTSPAEAHDAAALGVDALVVQGAEAGGHRGGRDDDPDAAVGLLALLQLVKAAVPLPLIATGGIMTGAAVAAVLALGARAAALGTAFLDCPEAGTAPVHRAALRADGTTALTRAFTGRTARGIRNRFLREHTAAPRAYPEVHHLTAPLRAAARAAGDPELVNLWAGQAYPLLRSMPARALVAVLDAERRAASAALAAG
jgi:nitronate monooxygenase